MAVDAIGTLGKTDFLNLLATQLRNQNPMSPMDTTAFIAQLAQFSALEAAENTRESVAALAKQETKTQAEALLGRTVSGVQSSTGQPFAGHVTAVDWSGSSPALYVNGLRIELSDIQIIA
jgi:flagellar basal-body rod modification protein FlgD